MRAPSSHALEQELSEALKRNELSVYYQPRINLRSGKIVANEALIRWRHPERGFVHPETFIPVAEKAGLIIPLGEWVLRVACLQNKRWQDAGFEPMVVSVNLSAVQFMQANLFEQITLALKDAGLDPQYLELEITESMTMDVDRAIPTLLKLKELGVSISMDDFGKGYSSLSYLKRFPIDTLKIDKSFVRECTVDVSDATIVKTIIAMAHNLDLNVVAEGVEDIEHLVFLQEHLCNEAQGYLFSKPLPAKELEIKFEQIPKLLGEYGIEPDYADEIWVEEQLRVARENLQATIRQQQGMTLKLSKINGKFIHTFCDGELLYRLGFVPQQIIGKELKDFLPPAEVAQKEKFYEKAWDGESVSYESYMNGIWYLASLRTIRRGGKALEVIASCVDITDRKKTEQLVLGILVENIDKAFIKDDKMTEYKSSVQLKDGRLVDIRATVIRNEGRHRSAITQGSNT